MDNIDYNVSIRKLVSQIIKSHEGVDTTNSKMLFDYYRSLFMIRHNLLHYFCLEMMGLPWTDEGKIKDRIRDDIPSEYGNKTPDIIVKGNVCTYMIDVSISHDIHKTEDNKRKKYLPIAKWLTDNGTNTRYIHINVDANNSNIDIETGKLRDISVKDFDTINYFRLQDIINDKKEFVSKNIDKEFFEQAKMEYYQRSKKSTKDTYFKDELSYIHMGNYEDLEMDIDIFKEYNDRFTHINNVEKNVLGFDEETFFTNLKPMLEDGHDIYSKYKDEKLSHDQFDNARSEIINRNEKTGKHIPKPTHHIMIPMRGTESIIEKGKQTEQKAVCAFFNTYLEDYENIHSDQKNNKLLFIRDFAIEFLYCFNDSLDKDINEKLYNDRGDELKEMKKEYTAKKLKLLFLAEYKKKKGAKINENLAIKMDLPFRRDNKIELKKYFKEIQQEDLTDANLSFRKYLRDKDIIHDEENSSYVKQNKIIRICTKKFKEESRVYYKKTGIGLDLNDRKNIDVRDRTTVDHNFSTNVDHFLDRMITPVDIYVDYKENDFLMGDHYGSDSVEALHWKKESVKNYSYILSNLQNTNCYLYSTTAHTCYKQLLHATQYNTGDNTFYVYNCGIENFIIIVALSYTKTTNDEGKPFMCVIKTKYPDDYTNFYGKIYKTKIRDSDYWYVYTNWRRLSLSKITYMCDSHFSVLSSTMNTILSSPHVSEYLLNKKIEKIYALRMMISYATNQKVGELLMDTRYAYMSAFSIYTNIQKLLVEKFGTTHSNILEIWIVKRLLDRLPQINKKALTDGILQNRIEMDDNVRDINTIGGVINLPSLWNDYNMKDITELLDEAFIYVHTMKEPSNIFHENIKAIKTIVQFQDEYDSLPSSIKNGMINHDNFGEYLMHDTRIGCSTAIIYHSTRHTIQREKPFFKKIIHEINDESIGELLSTKAVIKNTHREVIQEEKPSKRELLKKILRKEKIENRDLTSEEVENMKLYYLTTDTKFYNIKKVRQKVMETVLEYIENDNTMTKTIHMANNFIKNENGIVLADICIKAQYGAKREFYVVNMGAKSLARITENFFKKLSINSPNEAISIPGDDKIIEMQKMLDRIYFNPITPKHKVMYVNGDCTKWSAAETMSSFISMVYAMREYITEKMYNVLLATFNAWSDKKIQIPMDIYNKVIPREELGTGFLKKLQEEKKTYIRSTQNFLQGMFNYASSYKAVCCNNYTIYAWNKLYPKSTLIVEHMEHSDDYVLVVLYEDRKEFEKFRVLQKIMMRLHGYNDSDRKTSCQPFLLEFVSQMSFNGVMLYPQIKKSKEINLSLPCVGYKQDMDAALSRIGECARIGCNQSFLYFFQRLHVYRIADAYSILPGGVNSCGRDYKQLLNEPIELFGIPDILPILSLYCRGNGNNYRLYNYGGKNVKNIMNNLYLLSKNNLKKENTLIEDHEYEYSLQAPRFLYEVYNKTMRKFKNALDIGVDDIKNFWEENITYKLIKPRDSDLLIKWIKAMYYNRTFLEAYTKVNRTMMTMRISRFVKNKIVKPFMTYDDYTDDINIIEKRAMTMAEYYKETITLCSQKSNMDIRDYEMIRKIITKCDPTYSLIYSIMEKIQVMGVKNEKTRSIQVALKTPFKLKTINVMNNPGILLQYLYNKENFLKDKRTLLSKESLDKDVMELESRIPEEQLRNKTTMSILSIYNDLMINKEKRIVMFGYNRHVKLLLDSIMDIYSNNFLPGYVINLYMTNVLTVRDPVNDDILYTKGGRLTKDFYRQCLDNICLIYVWLSKHCKYTHKQTMDILEKIKFKVDNVGLAEEMDYRKILKMVTLDHMKQYQYGLDDKKIVSYLKVLFQNDYESLDELTNTVYSFSYKYILMDKILAGEYRGKTLVNYTYFNTTIEAYYERNFYDRPIMIINKYYQSVESILYNIALRLTNQLSQFEFERTINQNRLSPLKLKDLNDSKSFFKKYEIRWVVKYYGHTNKIVKINTLKEDDYILPIFKTGRKIRRLGDKHLDVGKIRPSLNEYNLSVMLGKSKIYTLPFWKCEQYDNMIVRENIYIDDVHLQEYLSQGRLKKYLMRKDYLSMPTICKLNNRDIVKKIINEIKRHKLYEYDLTNLIKSTDNEIIDILKNEPIYRRLNIDKKVLDDTILHPIGINFEEFFDEQVKKETMEREANEITDKGPKTEKDKVYNVLPAFDDIFGGQVISASLNDNALCFDFDDDFLVDIDDADVIPIEDDYNYIKPAYYGSELQNIISGGDYLSDVFIVDPKKKIYTKKASENQGYLVKKIENLRSFYILSYKERAAISKTPCYLTFPNFIEKLQNCIDLISYLERKGESLIEVYFLLEKILCNTYIIKNNSETVKDYVLKDRHITPCLWIRNRYTIEQLEKIKDKIMCIKDDSLLIIIPLDMYMRKYAEDRSAGLEIDQKICVSSTYDTFITNMKIKMLNTNSDFDTVLDNFLF